MTVQQAEALLEGEGKGISLAEFFESVPPNQEVVVTDYRKFLLEKGPEINIHCPSESCRGLRVFRESRKDSFGFEEKIGCFYYVEYVCYNCLRQKKIYSFRVAYGSKDHVLMKLGEHPAFGPPIPSRLISLVGPDREMFLRGRRSENLGLGVGAFVYYRRVVENQKNRILDSIAKVARKVGATEEAVAALEAAKNEDQFTNAVRSVRDAIPQSLLINGHNPLLLLHSALSHGVHDGSDEHCLEVAQSVRIVLGELAERLAQALKDEAELSGAVSRLLSVKGAGGREPTR